MANNKAKEIDDWEDVAVEKDDWEDVASSSDESSLQKVDSHDRNQALLESFAEGALPFFPLASAQSKVGELMGLGTYDELMDANTARQKKQREEHPGAALASEVAGAIMSGGGLLKGASKVAKATPVLKKLVEKAPAASALVANSAFGATNSYGKELNDEKKNTAAIIGGSIPLGLGGSTLVGSKVVQKIGEKAGPKAEEFATKTIGAIQGSLKKLRKQDQNKAHEIGRQMLDDNVVGWFNSADDMANRIASGKQNKIDQIAMAIDQADDLAKAGGLDKKSETLLKAAKFNKVEVAEQLKDQIRKENFGIPESELQPALNKIDEYLTANKSLPDSISIKQLQDLKVKMNRFFKQSDFYRNSNLGFAKEGLLTVRKALKEGIEKQGDAAAEVLGKSSGGIRNTNKALSNYLNAEDLIEQRLARDVGNNQIGLTDTMSMIGGGVLGAGSGGEIGQKVGLGILSSLGGLALNKAKNRFGNQIAAKSLDALSRAAPRLSGGMSKISSSPLPYALSGLPMGPERTFVGYAESATSKVVPQDIPGITSAIQADDSLSNTEKAKQIQLLNKYGRILIGR